MSKVYIRRPETVRLALEDGGWLLVKKFLTAGETRRVMSLMMRDVPDGGRAIDPVKVAIAQMIVYLVDWSITNYDGQPVNILGESDDVIASALDQLDPPVYQEIMEAITKHDNAMDAEREAEKKSRMGTTDPIRSCNRPVIPLAL